MARVCLRAKATNTHCTGMELALRFVLWMQAQATVPEAQQIADHFGIARSTGYRWRAFYLDATAQIDTPKEPRNDRSN